MTNIYIRKEKERKEVGHRTLKKNHLTQDVIWDVDSTFFERWTSDGQQNNVVCLLRNIHVFSIKTWSLLAVFETLKTPENSP